MTALGRDDLRAASRLVLREWWMFLRCITKPSYPPEPPTSWEHLHIRNAVISASAVAFRNLALFYDRGPRRKFPTDIGADDFIADWAQATPEGAAVLADTVLRVERRILHVTRVRIPEVDLIPRFEFIDCFAALAPFHNAFVQRVPTDLLDREWRLNMHTMVVLKALMPSHEQQGDFPFEEWRVRVHFDDVHREWRDDADALIIDDLTKGFGPLLVLPFDGSGESRLGRSEKFP